MESLGGGFVELGSQDLVFFSARGAQLRSVAHNYARPCISSGKTRFVLYNRAGYELRVESRTRTLYTNTYTQPILLAEMASNGTVAVVTDSAVIWRRLRCTIPPSSPSTSGTPAIPRACPGI